MLSNPIYKYNYPFLISLLVLNHNNRFASVLARVHRFKCLSGLSQTVKPVLSASDLPLKDEFGDLVVELWEYFSRFPSAVKEAADSDTALEDFLKILENRSIMMAFMFETEKKWNAE